MKSLSADDIERQRPFFEEAGYLVFRSVVDKSRLSALRDDLFAEYERAGRTGALFSGGGRISGHLNCFPGAQSRFAYEALRDHGILDLIAKLNPRATGAPAVGCNLNLPGSFPQHYHADGWYTGEFMIANVAVVDTVIENGAIDVLPRTHKKFYKFWRYATERAYRLSTPAAPRARRRAHPHVEPLAPRHAHLTTVARPMLAFTFGENRTSLSDPFTFNEGKISFHENWFRPTFAGGFANARSLQHRSPTRRIASSAPWLAARATIPPDWLAASPVIDQSSRYHRFEGHRRAETLRAQTAPSR